MVTVIWSRRAQQDLDDVCDFVAKGSPRYAERLGVEMLERSLLLETHPLLGKPVPELGSSNIRELIHGNYRLIYWVIAPASIAVIAIMHSRRLLRPSHIRSRKRL